MKQTIQLLAIVLLSASLVIGGVHLYKIFNKPDNKVVIGDYSKYGVTTEKPIVVFTREGCIYCKMLVAYFSEHNISFTDRSIDSPKTKLLFEQLDKNVTPIVLINNKMITGFQKKTITNELIKLGMLTTI